MVLNFAIQEGDEVSLVPLNRAIDYFKFNFGQRLTNQSVSSCVKILRSRAVQVSKQDESKYLHLNSVREAISLDEVAELVI